MPDENSDEKSRPTRFRFGVFELDLQRRIVTKNGQQIRMQEKPFLTLALLLERAGDVVTREELRSRLWPSDTFVEFDDNLNSTIKRVRETLGDAALHPRYIETVPKRGYRFIPPVEVIYPTSDVPPSETQRSSALTSSVSPRSRPVMAVAIVIAIAMLVGLAVVIKTQLFVAPEQQKIMLAVLPFRNLSGDASQEYLSDGITEQLIAHLGRLNPAKLGVISTTSVMRLKNKADDLPSISDQLDVGLVLEGSVRRMDGRIAVTTQLVRVSDRTHLWSETYETLTSDALYRTVSRGVAKALAIRLLPSDEAALARAATTNTAAYEAHLAGLYQWNRGTKESFQAALESFRRAGDLDPAYPLAHIGLAKCYFELGEYRFIRRDEAMAKAREHIAIALKLDDTIPEVHALAAAVLDSSDPSATGVDEGYRKAIQLNPSDARVRCNYAMYLMYHHRGGEAVPQIREATRLDPLSASAHSHAAAVYFATGDSRHSWEESERALAFDPNYPFALHIQGRLYLREGKTEGAITQLQKAVAASGRTPKYLYALARAYLAAGSREPARQLLAELTEKAKIGYVPSEYLEGLSQALAR